MNTIRIGRAGVEYGPYPVEEVERLWAAGQLLGSDLAWTEGMTEWIPLHKMPGVTAPPAPPLPPAGSYPRPSAAYAGGYPPYTGSPLPVTSGAAVVSMVFGILGVFLFPLSLVAVICGHVSRSAIKKSKGLLTGDGMALAGLILGYLMLLLGVGVCVAIFAGLSSKIKQQAEEKRLASTPEGIIAIRRDFTTTLLRQEHESEAAPEPPPESGLRLVQYRAPEGLMDAYVSAKVSGSTPLPVIVWLSGGFSNSIGGNWIAGAPENDQSGTAFQQPGLNIMYPSLRGGNKNPGVKEGLFGEVEDVLAALKWLKTQPGVDAKRIYLGGHSTGGTLALLVAPATRGLRAVISFGPVAEVADYGQEVLPFDVTNAAECRMRMPISWLSTIQCPGLIIEGKEDGNTDSLRGMKTASLNANLQFFEVAGRDHFSVLQPVSKLLAKLILKDTGTTPQLPLTSALIQKALPAEASP
jgi:alpha/beta superfamily hydrolase